MDKKEIAKLALDTFQGKVFTSDHIELDKQLDMLPLVFLPLGFMDEKGQNELMAKQPSMFYQFLAEAGPTAVNGYPSFMTFNVLNKAEHRQFIDEYLKYQDIADAALGDEECSNESE